jgi:hypothetical protein
MRKRASARSHSLTRTLLAIGRPRLWKHVVRHFIGFDAERISDQLGGIIAVIAVSCLFEKVGHIRLTN